MDIEQFLKEHDIKNYKTLPQQPIDLDNNVWIIRNTGYLDKKSIKERHYNDIGKFIEKHKDKLIVVRLHSEMEFTHDAELYGIITRLILLDKDI